MERSSYSSANELLEQKVFLEALSSTATVNTSKTKQHVDVLVLHGLAKQVVDYVIELCQSLDLRASTVVDLPSLGRAQNERVNYYINKCQVCIVIISFDDHEPGSKKARPNVYDELRSCRESRPKDTIVLHERRDSEQVMIPSNLEGQLVLLPFRREALHQSVPSLIRELRARTIPRQNDSNRFLTGKLLNSFLDKMDRLWDDDLDVAWEKIHRQDYDAEREFAIILDQFFQCYHDAIVELARHPNDRQRLTAAFEREYGSAVEVTVRAWEVIAEGKMRLADVLHAKPAQAEHRAAALYDRGHIEFRRGKGKSRTAKEAISHFKAAIELLDRYMSTRR
jgi:hypothetical protein